VLTQQGSAGVLISTILPTVGEPASDCSLLSLVMTYCQLRKVAPDPAADSACKESRYNSARFCVKTAESVSSWRVLTGQVVQ
jgi:hypothetical protein